MADPLRSSARIRLAQSDAQLLETCRETIRQSRELLEWSKSLVSSSPAGPLIRRTDDVGGCTPRAEVEQEHDER
jgi:hypothetical protein